MALPREHIGIRAFPLVLASTTSFLVEQLDFFCEITDLFAVM